MNALRRLDDRFTRSGPLKVLRVAPQVGALLIGALVLGGGIRAIVVHRAHPTVHVFDVFQPTTAATGQAGGGSGDQGTVTVSGTVGPAPGSSVPDYIARRKAALAAAADPGAPLAAVVSFTTYRKAQDAAGLVPGATIAQVLVHAPVAGRPTLTGVVRFDVLAQALTTAEHALRHEADENDQLAATTTPTTPDLAAQAHEDRAEAASERTQATAYAQGGCVYALVVSAPLATLRALAAAPGVRLVDIAAPHATADKIEPVGLYPDDAATVSTPAPVDLDVFLAQYAPIQ